MIIKAEGRSRRTMNYYEELGIDPSATEEEIARAHRRLARLMHPDQQVDDAVKKLAETQMRRLNAIVEVLNNPEKRHLYDEGLHGKGSASTSSAGAQARAKATLHTLHPTPSLVLGFRRIWRALPWWVWSTGGALAMTLAISWIVADYTGSSFENRPTDYVRPKDEPENKDHKPEPDRLAAPAPPEHSALAALNRLLAAIEAGKSKPATAIPDKNEPIHPEVEAPGAEAPKVDNANKESSPANSNPETVPAAVAPAPGPLPAVSGPDAPRTTSSPTKPSDAQAPGTAEVAKTAAAVSTTKPIELKPTPLTSAPKPAEPKPASTEPVAAPDPGANGKTALASAPVSTAARPESQDPLAGDWVYAPVEPEKAAKGFFPPEFIELRLVSEQGLLRGEYRARYRVTNTPVRPDVDFQVVASAANSKKMSWQSSDGSKGVLKITPVDEQNIKVEWKRTTKSQATELNIGSATLTRRNIQ